MPVTDTYSFEDDEPIEDVIAAWNAGEPGVTSGPRRAPSLMYKIGEVMASGGFSLLGLHRQAPDKFERAIPAPMETR